MLGETLEEEGAFLSTLPARGATKKRREDEEKIFLSTLPARGATTVYHGLKEDATHISIHAPREGSDAGRPTGSF